VIDAKGVIKGQMVWGANLMQLFSSDLSDDEFFFQPTAGGSHLGWILGHLAGTQDWAVANVTGQPQRLPTEINERFGFGSEISADRSRFLPRAEVEALFRDTQAHSLSVLADYDLSQWNEPTPEGVPSEYFPTMGSLWNLLPLHTFWHFGQLTVNRRMLGKPSKLM